MQSQKGNAKVMFTADEISMMQDAHLMPAKHRILEKAATFFGEMGKDFSGSLSAQVSLPVYYKITHGDHLEAQPWCLLDVPKIDHEINGCYFRILFWWGQCVRHQIYAPAEFATMFSQENAWEIIDENIWNQRTKPTEHPKLISGSTVRFQKDFPILSLTDQEIHQQSFELFTTVYTQIHGIRNTI